MGGIPPGLVGSSAGGILCVYGLVLWMQPAQAIFWSPDEGGKYLLLRGMAAGLAWNAPLSYPGAGLDPALAHVPLLYWLPADGAFYSWWPVWFPALSAPVYALLSGVLGSRALLLLPALAGLSTGLLAHRSVGHALGAAASPWFARLAGIVILFGTPLFFYAFTFWEHTLHVALLMAAFLLLVQSMTGRSRWHAGGSWGCAWGWPSICAWKASSSWVGRGRLSCFGR